MLDYVVESEEKTQAKRAFRAQAVLNKEREFEEKLIREQLDKQIREEKHQQELRLANELERLKLEQLKDSKLRQQLRESSYEIRALENKLREGYVNKVCNFYLILLFIYNFAAIYQDDKNKIGKRVFAHIKCRFHTIYMEIGFQKRTFCKTLSNISFEKIF